MYCSPFISGQSVSPPFPFDCLPTFKACEGKTDCPKSYPVCSAGRCCRRPIFPPLCPGGLRGPKCGRLDDPPCKPGYTCRLGYCCRDVVVPPRCPSGHISGPLCPPSRCPAVFTCVKGRCCRKRIITPRCPKEMLYTGRCRAGRCRVGSCINGACCLKMAPLCPLLRRGPQCGPKDPPCKQGYTCTGGYCCRDEVTPPKCPAGHISGPLCPPSRCPPWFTCMNGRCCRRRIINPRCPKGMLYTGRCRAGRCRFGSCINGACCRKINPLPKCPRPFVYTGRCINGKCKIGNCMKGACCRGPIIKPPPFGKLLSF